MKSRTLNILSSALIALSAFFFASGLSLAEEESSVTQPVTITVVLGKVEVLAKDALIWQEAKKGVELFEGDKIKTGVDGKAELTLKDGSYIKLKEETTLGIKTAREEAVNQASQYELDFRVGEIMVELKKLKKGSSFKVETPTAVAAVRGTTYYMRTGTKIVDGVEKSYVEIYVDSDDMVLFTNTVSGESCIASQGRGAIVYDDGTVEGPFPIPPEEQDAWKSGFDMIYDDSGGKKGMRDVNEESGDEEDDDTGDDDTSGDIDDTTAGQDDAQDDANQDQSGEQDITGLAKVTIITDSDGDGIIDSWEIASETNYGTNYLVADTDDDGIDDFEDAFPDNAYDPEIDESYGSWEALRQAGADNLAVEDLQYLREDIADLIDDIHARGYEAAKENIFDHQAGKVMTDHWGNRVRVESYISKPTNDQVQILALNLRTAGPNAGISSLDYRIKFYSPITGLLKDLPWDDYMSNPLNKEYGDGEGTRLNPDYDVEAQLILYEQDGSVYYNPSNKGYPIPETFSLEVKNPYDNSVKAIETYSKIKVKDETIWYQIQEGSRNMYINGQRKTGGGGPTENEWGRGWNQANRFTFLDNYEDGSWLMGAFYLIDDNGNLVDVESGKDGLLDIHGIRDCINPDYNLEMVFFSSEFGDTSDISPDLPEDISKREEMPDYTYETYLHNTYRTIDVISIPEITTPYLIQSLGI